MGNEGLAQLSGCKNGNCPKIYRKGDRAAVQGLPRPDPAWSRQLAEEVEIPIEILLEAVTGLATASTVPRTLTADVDRHVTVLGDRVLVRGRSRTDLTDLIPAPRGESVVEVPITALTAAVRRLAVAA